MERRENWRRKSYSYTQSTRRRKKSRTCYTLALFCRRLIYATISCIGNITSLRWNMKGTNINWNRAKQKQKTQKTPACPTGRLPTADQSFRCSLFIPKHTHVIASDEHVVMWAWEHFGVTVRQASEPQCSAVGRSGAEQRLAFFLLFFTFCVSCLLRTASAYAYNVCTARLGWISEMTTWYSLNLCAVQQQQQQFCVLYFFSLLPFFRLL